MQIPPNHTQRFLVFLSILLMLGACQPVPTVTTPNPASSESAQVPGVTDTEIILGAHTSLTGPVAAYSVMSRTAKAYFDFINESEGGVHGRKIIFLMEDDGYSPPKTVDVVHKLVEQDQVFAMFQGFGTPTHMQVVDYLQERGVPDLLIAGTAIEWSKDPQARPTAFSGILNGVGEGATLGLYLSQAYAGKKIGLVYQNDDAGLDFIDGMKRGMDNHLTIVGEESYNPTDPDLNAQINRLQAAGAEVIGGHITLRPLVAALKHARLNLNWQAPFVISNVTANDFLMDLAGAALVEGTVSVHATRQAYELDQPSIVNHAELLKKYSDIDKISFLSIVGQFQAEMMVEILKRAGRDLTRAKLVQAAETIHDFQCSVCLFPMSMSDTDHDPVQAVVLSRAEGGKWVPFGETGVSWEGTLAGPMTVRDLKSVPSPYTK